MSYRTKRLAILLGSILLITSTAGCSTNTSENTEQSGDLSDSTSDSTVTSDGILNADDMFTERDLAGSYDEASATIITLSDGASSCDSASVSVTDDTITITGEGTYLLSGSLSDGQIIVDVKDSEKVQLVLDGVTITNSSSAAIYVREADKVFLTLADGTSNSLSVTGDFVAIDDNNIDGVIFSKADLTLNGTGTLTIDCAYKHGIVSKDDLVIADGTYQITAASHALSGKDSVRIADGTFFLNAGTDGIHSENTDDGEKGFIFLLDGDYTINCESDAMDASYILQIENGTYQITAGDDGLHSDSALYVMNGDITIASCYEGLEGETITIEDGSISITASDDGLNAASASTSADTDADSTDNQNTTGFGGKFGGEDPFESDDSCMITINGGCLTIDADGDGIDSNGNLLINGGEIYIEGPENDGNGALDYAGNAAITGGTVIAAGYSGMAQNFGTDSTQGAMLVSFSSAGNDTITLMDADGNILLTYTPEKSYNCVVLSSPDIIKGGIYTVTSGSQSVSVEMTDLIYGSYGMGGMGTAPGGMGTAPGDMDATPGDMDAAPGDMDTAPEGMDGIPDKGTGKFPDDGMGQAPDGEMKQLPDGETGQTPDFGTEPPFTETQSNELSN